MSRQLLEEITNYKGLQRDVAEALPANYNFEVAKTIWKIRTTRSRLVALQFPEGLLVYSCAIADLLEKYCDDGEGEQQPFSVIIMADVTYGACCVDDFTAKAIGCHLLVHYGHSCLVPIQNTSGIHMLYVFVDVRLNTSHFVDTLRANFAPMQTLALVSTIQFVKTLQNVQQTFLEMADHTRINIAIPQRRPLSPGEILGCTAPVIPAGAADALVFLGDGRFHLESAMIANPSLAAYQYDPYSRRFTRELFDFERMSGRRAKAVKSAASAASSLFGIILGTLGRQGNLNIVNKLEEMLAEANKRSVRVLMSEICPSKLEQFQEVDCWVQVACPRLSIDWSAAFAKPIVTPFELAAALKLVNFESNSYPMDYYANDSLGPWTNNHSTWREKRKVKRSHVVVEVGR